MNLVTKFDDSKPKTFKVIGRIQFS